ncbi:DUF2267 domain-containing protein [Streptomyces rubiginosohelvolus]
MTVEMTLLREAFLDRVKERGEYGTVEEAERAARVVRALLGAHLVGEVRAQLAARLPGEFALILLNPRQSAEPLPRSGSCGRPRPGSRAPPNGLRRGTVSAVLSTVADAAGEDLLRQILLRLPVGYDLLLGRPQPT